MQANSDATRTSQSNTPTARSTPPPAGQGASTPPPPSLPGNEAAKQEMGIDGLDNAAFIGSPMKKQRASVSGPDDEHLRRRMGGRISAGIHEIMGSTPPPPGIAGGCLTANSDNIDSDGIGKD